MKKLIMAISLCMLSVGISYADGNAFTPLNFNDTEYNSPANPVAKSVATPAQAVTPANAAAASSEDVVGNTSIQNAILQLDNAQVDIRNDLLNAKAKFADVDSQYKVVKAERKALQKQVKSIEKRIKDIDKAKEKIRKNMV